MTRWTEEMTYKFVTEYLNHECLYNCKDPRHKSKGARNAALQQLSEVMEIPGFGSREAYIKLRNIKSTYSQELKKIKQSTISGAGTGEVYVPQLKWFKLLDDAFKSINVQCRDSQIKMEHDSHHSNPDGEEDSQQNQDSEKNNPHVTFNINEERTIRDLNRLVNKVKNVADAISIPTQTENEFDIFGKSVAAQLKSMPLPLAIQGQMYIQNYLCNLRLQQMGEATPDYAHQSSPSYTSQPP